MARALKEEQITPADELRWLLSSSESLVAKLRGSPENTEQLLANLDLIAELWPVLEAEGVDLRPEMGRWETLQAQVRRREGDLLRALRPAGGLRAARERTSARRAGQTEWWWHLDEARRQRLRRSWTRTGLITVGVVVAGFAIVALLRVLFPVDPNVQRASTLITQAQNKLENSADYAGAIAAFQEATTLTPDDPEPWLWLGCTQEKIGDAAAAAEAFQQAEVLYANDTAFQLARSQAYLTLNVPEKARADLASVLAREPDNAQAYYLLASVDELLGDYVAALTELDKAATLAEASDAAELTVMARYRYAMLLQQYQTQSLLSDVTATPAP